MKKTLTHLLLIAAAIAFTIYSCKKDHNPPPQPSGAQYNINQTNLVADIAGFSAARVDTNLVNAWGLAVNPTGIVWLSSNHKSLSTVYDSTGQTLKAPVTIPSFGNQGHGYPTGVVYNGTSSFISYSFIFANEDGVITAWFSGGFAETMADHRAQNAVYKGLAMAADGDANFLYAANFFSGKIDVFDHFFNDVINKPFVDATIPAGFAPFNIQNIGGMLYVTYAKQKGPDNSDDEAGPGNGYVNIFKPDGMFVKRFASKGTLNSPWGITHAPAGFAAASESILVGNFGDGRINIFDLNGNYKGQLQNNGKPVGIEGLWALSFLKPTATSADKLYFTAGPGDEAHGLFGYLKSSPVTQTTTGTIGN